MSGIAADDQYEQANDNVAGDVPSGDVADSGYTSRVGQKTASVPVQNDDAPVEDPINPATANSDETLGAYFCSPISMYAIRNLKSNHLLSAR